MKKILLIKTSSLGDVIHALPAVTDLKAVVPDAHIDWVVEESLLPIVRLHPGVSECMPVAMRRWRRAWWRRPVREEISAGRRRLRAQTYDAIIDAQGLIKSALIARAARGVRHGLDFHSAREPLAPFYHHTYRIPWDLHAVERTRLLFARAIGYAVPPKLDYGIHASARTFPWLAVDSYAVLLHASSGDYKLWRESDWKSLGDALNGAGIACVLPAGTAKERERSARIAGNLQTAIVPPSLSLEELTGLLGGAKVVIGVDTGLTHLAAALAAPTIGIYNATDPAATGIYGCPRAINLGGIGQTPTVQQVISALRELGI
ncbi:MAG: Lipopolysaccharide heptosyltransferase [Betaproteobacteria bacterium]|nr:Lipopolysaccharide heptosyltransferase [Betaproteobacteria bacterium]